MPFANRGHLSPRVFDTLGDGTQMKRKTSESPKRHSKLQRKEHDSCWGLAGEEERNYMLACDPNLEGILQIGCEQVLHKNGDLDLCLEGLEHYKVISHKKHQKNTEQQLDSDRGEEIPGGSSPRSNPSLFEFRNSPLGKTWVDSDSSSHSSSNGSWFTLSNNTRSNSPNDEFYDQSRVKTRGKNADNSLGSVSPELQDNFENELVSDTPDPPPSVPSPGRESNQASSSYSAEDNDLSTEGGSSSQSQPSSKDADCTVEGNFSSTNQNTLQGVLDSVLRNAGVAKSMFHHLEGKLECTPPNANLDIGSSLSMLSLLDIQDPSPVKHHGAIVYAPSSASGSSGSSSSSSTNNSASANNSSSSSSGGHTGNVIGPGNTMFGKELAGEDSPGQSTKQYKSNPKLDTSTSDNAHSLRCFHNVLQPEVFCVNHQTRDRFRSCAGPGWNTVQHLKEHMLSHHTKKSDSLKCSACQDVFKSQKSLKTHNDTDDCIIRCPDCSETFETKKTRTAHQIEKHSGADKPSRFIEIDDRMWKKIKENLKTFTESLKKGKGDSDHKLTNWIEKNTPRYMIGRTDKTNSTLELGQWYNIFCTLSSSDHVPEHPFYDFPPLSATDFAEERILLIYKSLVKTNIDEIGPPPSDIESQIGWYEEALRDTLRIAAKTRLVLENEQKSTTNTTMPTPYQPGPSLIQGPVYSTQITPISSQMSTNPEMTLQQDTAVVHHGQLPIMSHELCNMGPITPAFFPEGQQQSEMMTSVTSSSTSNGMVDVWGSSHHMQQQPVGPYNFDLQQSYNTPQGYSTQQSYDDQQGFNGQLMWPDSTVSQSSKDLEWPTMQPERRQ